MSIISHLHTIYAREKEKMQVKGEKDPDHLVAVADKRIATSEKIENVHRINSLILANKALKLYEKAFEIVKKQKVFEKLDSIDKKIKHVKAFMKHFTQDEIDEYIDKSEGDVFRDEARKMMQQAEELKNKRRIASIKLILAAIESFEDALDFYIRESRHKAVTTKEELQNAKRMLDHFTKEELAYVKREIEEEK